MTYTVRVPCHWCNATGDNPKTGLTCTHCMGQKTVSVNPDDVPKELAELELAK